MESRIVDVAFARVQIPRVDRVDAFVVVKDASAQVPESQDKGEPAHRQVQGNLPVHSNEPESPSI